MKKELSSILQARNSRYGDFYNHAKITQELKQVITKALQAQGKTLSVDKQEALDMIMHKVGRIVNGDPEYADSWVDIAGYAQLVADRLQSGSLPNHSDNNRNVKYDTPSEELYVVPMPHFKSTL